MTSSPSTPAPSTPALSAPAPLRWGILGTGRIAATFARGVAASQLGRLVAVGSRTPDSAKKFAAEHAVAADRAHGSYEALFADPEVDAIYIGTPHPQHAAWAIRAAEAGKHVLCEKPLGLNHAEGMVMVQAARDHGVVLMEAFMYRCHPQTARVAELIREGALGEVRMVQAAFSFRSGFDAGSRLWSNAAGGGGILDVGCYPVSMARLVAGAASGQPFLNPVKITGAGRLHPETGVDEYAAATLEFPNGVIAQVSTGIGVTQDNVVRIYGAAGWLHIPSPWVVNRDGGASRILLHRAGAPAPEEITIEGAPLYALEADAFARAVRAGLRDVPEMSTDDTLGNLATLDQWRAAIGLVYESEKPENYTQTIARRPLAVRDNSRPGGAGGAGVGAGGVGHATAIIPHTPLPGVEKSVSRLVMGCDNQRTMPHAAAMWDDFFERGGNAFDTGYIYGGGLMEKLLGQWIRHRGVRDQVAILAKGAHTPDCTPEGITRQLEISLDRLQTGYTDVYLMHRDNPDVPVGEFVDVLNRHAQAGRIRIFGGSNWSRERVEAANEYARKHRLQGFGAWSNQFSLARLVEPMWKGCLSAGDHASRHWLLETSLPLFAWSSQARGFFTDRAGPDKRADAELVRCWYSDDNFARRERAVELAAKKGVSPIAIAGSYVLSQPFPTFALIGPRTIAETVSSLECLKIPLTLDELAWLNLEKDTL
ncbi:MAG: aldo/keto reductase [Opitutaceae bacterium]|jgi:predicted dehydrogenase/aryl-alcohol dehydrogenase-like predicted oxidoreductase|nr:aldo/keto reductase [Opitutaceae bacterium]